MLDAARRPLHRPKMPTDGDGALDLLPRAEGLGHNSPCSAFAARDSAGARAIFRASMSGRRVILGSGESHGLSLVNC